VTSPIPGTVSGFTARDAFVYLPAAYTSQSRPLLPVLVLVSGQPGGPQDWIVSGELQSHLDSFAQANGGLAPVTVVVDPNGLSLPGRAELDQVRAGGGREPRPLGVRRLGLTRAPA
jgi:hypothetical protein